MVFQVLAVLLQFDFEFLRKLREININNMCWTYSFSLCQHKTDDTILYQTTRFCTLMTETQNVVLWNNNIFCCMVSHLACVKLHYTNVTIFDSQL